MDRYDVAIIGAGIVGLATAWRVMQRFPTATICVIEKENHVAAHQSGHNSGVLHSGIYYRPGSMKARNCRQGKRAMEAFCQEYDIPFEICGKVIVAVDESEFPQLQTIFERGQANGVSCTMISGDRLRELEPHAAGVAAIHVPEAGIVDYRSVCEKLAERIVSAGHRVQLSSPVTGISPEQNGVVIRTSDCEIAAKYLVTCGGLWEDRLIRMSGARPEAQVVPFRGEFLKLVPAAEHLCRTLIYPVPDPRFPFLGVHFTKLIEGGVECGPNAVLAFSRAGYRKSDVRLGDLFESLTYSGFRRMALKHWRTGLGEMWRSWNKAAFVRALQRLVPEIRSEHLIPAPAGVRAQALTLDGDLVDGFVIQRKERIVHVGNAPSPAATASLNIGNVIVDHLVEAGLSDNP